MTQSGAKGNKQTVSSILKSVPSMRGGKANSTQKNASSSSSKSQSSKSKGAPSPKSNTDTMGKPRKKYVDVVYMPFFIFWKLNNHDNM